MASSLLFCTGMIGFLLFHIRSYPITASLCTLVLLRTIIDAKIEKLVVWEDRMAIVTQHSLPFLTQKQTIFFSAVESIDSMMERNKTFFVRYKDGDERALSPGISFTQFQKAMGVMGMLNEA